MPTNRLASRLYPELQRRRKRQIPFGRRLQMWVSMNIRKIVFVGILLATWMIAHVYWYNKLTDLEYNIQMAWAQVEAEQERRYHIQQDVTRLVVAYAQHERDLMLDLTVLRADATASGDGRAHGPSPTRAPKPDAATGLDKLSSDDLGNIFPQIMLVAEQYPNLRLTENFQQFSTAIIETETRITEHIEAYNQEVNTYTTVIKQFPGNIFGTVWGFDYYYFYAPERDDLVFRPVEYDSGTRRRSATKRKGVARDSDDKSRR